MMPGLLVLETARLRLRQPHPDDAPALVALMTPAVSRWVARWPTPFTLGLAEARIDEALAAIARGRALVYAIESQGTLAGWIGGGRLPEIHRASFGFWLGEPHHGQAMMQEAAPAFVAALRSNLALRSIEAACQPENRPSARVLTACGLRHVGSRMQYAAARDRDELVNVWEHTWPGLPEA